MLHCISLHSTQLINVLSATWARTVVTGSDGSLKTCLQTHQPFHRLPALSSADIVHPSSRVHQAPHRLPALLSTDIVHPSGFPLPRLLWGMHANTNRLRHCCMHGAMPHPLVDHPRGMLSTFLHPYLLSATAHPLSSIHNLLESGHSISMPMKWTLGSRSAASSPISIGLSRGSFQTISMSSLPGRPFTITVTIGWALVSQFVSGTLGMGILSMAAGQLFCAKRSEARG